MHQTKKQKNSETEIKVITGLYKERADLVSLASNGDDSEREDLVSFSKGDDSERADLVSFPNGDYSKGQI